MVWLRAQQHTIVFVMLLFEPISGCSGVVPEQSSFWLLASVVAALLVWRRSDN
jgi:hypothetical protein